MVNVKKGDFVRIKFVGRVKDGNAIFDLNDEEVAKKEEIYNKNHKYEPQTVCVGQQDVVKGLDEALVGKEVGKKFSVELSPDDAFGRKDARLFQLVSASKFKDNEMVPYPGMQVTINNNPGVVKTISGGRVMVDFNHPLSGRDVKYDVEVVGIVTDDVEKVKSFVDLYLGKSDANVTISDGVAKIEMEFPVQLADAVGKKIIERIPSLKKVEFGKKEEKKQEANAEKKEAKVPNARKKKK